MEERIIELESMVSWQDDTIRQLNEVVIELRGEIADIAARLKVTEGKLQEVAPALVVPQDEESPPPHY